VRAALSPGDPCPWLAAELRQRYGAVHVVLTDSGTSALALALQIASARRPGLPCLLPAYGCYDLATAALAARVPVRLYDLDPLTLAPDSASLAGALGGGAAALVVVHLYGVPVPIEPVRAAARAADGLLIEDAAQGVGGSWGDRPLGAHGDLSVLSFGRGKGMTGGGGGALLVRTPALTAAATSAPVLRPARDPMFVVKLLAQWLLGRPAAYALPASVPALRLGETIFHAPSPVRALRAASARVLSRTLPALDGENARRRLNGLRLAAAAARQGLHAVRASDGGTSGALRLPVLLPAGHPTHGPADARLGIMRGYPMPLTELAALVPALVEHAPMAGAARLARDLWTMPTHGRVMETDLIALESWLVRHGSISP
jgi:perosamine synthetase